MNAPDRTVHADVLLVAPAAAGRLSGGFLVNDALRELAGIRVADAEDEFALERVLARFAGTRTVLADSIYLFDESCARALTRAARTRPVVLLAHSLPSLIPGRPVHERLELLSREKGFLSVAEGAISPGAAVARALTRRGLDPARVRVATPPPLCDGRTARSGERGRGEPLRILTVANWSAAKGVLDAARALASLPHRAWTWSVVGARDAVPELAESVDTLLAERDLADRVTMVGRVEPAALAGYYAAADLFLLPSYMESYGIAFAEAITFGLPVVAYACAEVPRVVEDAGILCAAGSVAELAAAIETLASDNRRALAGLGEAARQVAARLPDRERFRASLISALEQFTDAAARLEHAPSREAPR